MRDPRSRSARPQPSMIMIVRHAEKPTEANGQRGVRPDGGHDEHSLNVRGWVRAGALVGLFFGLPGIVLGPFVGAVVAELIWERRNLRQAGRSGLGATIGLALGVAAKLALAFAMLGIFALVRFAGGSI